VQGCTVPARGSGRFFRFGDGKDDGGAEAVAESVLRVRGVSRTSHNPSGSGEAVEIAVDRVNVHGDVRLNRMFQLDSAATVHRCRSPLLSGLGIEFNEPRPTLVRQGCFDATALEEFA